MVNGRVNSTGKVGGIIDYEEWACIRKQRRREFDIALQNGCAFTVDEHDPGAIFDQPRR